MKKSIIFTIIAELVVYAINALLIVLNSQQAEKIIVLSIELLPILISAADSVTFIKFKWEKLVITLPLFIFYSYVFLNSHFVISIIFFFCIYSITSLALMFIKTLFRDYKNNKTTVTLSRFLVVTAFFILVVTVCTFLLGFMYDFCSSLHSNPIPV